MPRDSSRPARSVPNIRAHAKLPLASFIPCQSLIAPGLMFPWTLSLAFHLLMVTVILTVVDQFSGSDCWIRLLYSFQFTAVLPKLPTAKETAEIMCFAPVTSSLIRGHSSLFGVLQPAGVRGFHPQSSGQAKCINQEMENALRCLASHKPASWSKQLLWVK